LKQENKSGDASSTKFEKLMEYIEEIAETLGIMTFAHNKDHEALLDEISREAQRLRLLSLELENSENELTSKEGYIEELHGEIENLTSENVQLNARLEKSSDGVRTIAENKISQIRTILEV